MHLEASHVFAFSNANGMDDAANTYLAIFALQAVLARIPVRIVTTAERLAFWEAEMPNSPLITIVTPTSPVMRREKLPKNTAILADWALPRGFLSIVRTKAYREGVNITYPT